jgi:hypothetical protein
MAIILAAVALPSNRQKSQLHPFYVTPDTKPVTK